MPLLRHPEEELHNILEAILLEQTHSDKSDQFILAKDNPLLESIPDRWLISSLKRFQDMGLISFNDISEPEKDKFEVRILNHGMVSFLAEMRLKLNLIKKFRFMSTEEIVQDRMSTNLELLKRESEVKDTLVVTKENILVSSGRWKVVKAGKNKVIIFYDDNFSKPISTNTAWYKVFYRYLESQATEVRDLVGMWNRNARGGYTKHKTRDDKYILKVNQYVKEGLRRNGGLDKFFEVKRLKKI